MGRSTVDLQDRELTSLGFRIIAGRELLFRPNCYQHEYAASKDPRDPNEVSIKADYEPCSYLQQTWDLDET